MSTQTPTPQPTVVTPATPEPPRLLSKRQLRDYYFAGKGRHEADRIFSVLPVVKLPGSGKHYVRRELVDRYIDRHEEAGVA